MKQPLTRRNLIAAGIVCAVSARLASAGSNLKPTPSQGPGPFYPKVFGADAGPDLTDMGLPERAAMGEPLTLRGQVRTQTAQGLSGVRVEIWQCNAAGRYRHPHDARAC